MSTKNTNEFMASLPHGPLVHLLGQAHAIAHYLPEVGRAGLDREPGLVSLEYSLRRIAEYTAETEPGLPVRPQSQDVDWAKVGETIREAARTAFDGMQQGLDRLKRGQEARRAALSPEQRDRVSQARYDRAVARERRIGLAYVDSLFVSLRREWGVK